MFDELKTNNIHLIKGNCLDIMPKINSNIVSLVLTDPPYGINYISGFRKKEDRFDKILNDNDISKLIPEYFKECYRIMEKDGAIYVFCSWHNIDFFKIEFQKYFKLKNIIVWNKNNHGSGDLKGAYAPKYELVLYGYKNRKTLNGRRVADVLEYDKVPCNKLVHPTEKPLNLLKLFIEKSTNPNDIVFDGFMGSGSCGLACKELDRKFIGIELDDKYFDIACNRLKG